uniref:Uncharacterized protein n=1 Tax=Panagrolaimus sp. JU765 TaxID=591449 RepID=A0AC34QBU3_9BILA
MQAINRAMEQLKIKQNLENAKNNSSKTQKSPPQKLREWLQKVEKELEWFRSGLTGKMIGGIANLQKMASDHQVGVWGWGVGGIITGQDRTDNTVK